MALATESGLFVVADNFQRRISHYVPACQFDAAVDPQSRNYRVSLGTPAAASASTQAVLAAQAITTAGTATTLVTSVTDSPYGRALVIDLSGAGTPTVTIKGRDYLGQPVTEALTGNGTTAVNGVKAFKWIDSVTWTAVAAVTLDVGFADKLGLPFRTNKIIAEIEDGVAAGTLGTLVAGVRTDPQTSTTVDPRGTYDPNGTLDATAEFEVIAVADPFINASGNGGLHGIAHYYA